MVEHKIFKLVSIVVMVSWAAVGPLGVSGHSGFRSITSGNTFELKTAATRKRVTLSGSTSVETIRNVRDLRGGAQGEEEGKATILSSVFNLVNNVAGAGILTLSSGMSPGTGWIPAMVICAVLGALSKDSRQSNYVHSFL
jgi:hypothetical protein